MEEPAPGAAPPPSGGLRLPFDVLVAPQRAFATIAATRQWAPAYCVLVVLGLLELWLLAPGLAHVLAVQTHGGAPAETAGVVRSDLLQEGAMRLLGPFAAWGFVAVLLAVATIGSRNPPPPFSAFFSLCMNCAIPAAIGGVVSAAAIRLHDPASFRTVNDLLLAAPISLGSLRPGGQPREVAFLAYWDVFTLWTYALIGFGYAALAKISPAPALLLALTIGLSFALMFAVAS